MSEWLAHIDFAWPWAALLLALPLLTRFLPLPAKTTDERVRVPFLPSLIDALQLDTRPKRGSGASAVLFWLIWSLLVCALARPEYLTPPQYIARPMRDIVLILDVSGQWRKMTSRAVIHACRRYSNRCASLSPPANPTASAWSSSPAKPGPSPR